MFKPNILIVALIALNISACGEFSSSDSKASTGGGSLSLARKPFGTCDRRDVVTINLCMEAVGSDYNDAGYLGILQSSCESSGGVYSTNNCDPAGAFGLCIVSGGQPNATYVSYYPPQYTADSAKSACQEGGGVFIPY